MQLSLLVVVVVLLLVVVCASANAIKHGRVGRVGARAVLRS